MKKFSFLFAAIIGAATVFAQPCTNLFFAEYVEGSSSNKALELYNPTSGAISLSGYSIVQYNNGSVTPTYTFNLNGTIAAGGVYTVANRNADAYILALTDTATSSSVMNFNGNDVLALMSGTDTLDRIGAIGNSANIVFDTTNGLSHSYVRMANVQQGTTDWSVGQLQWITYPKDTIHLGSHTMTSCGSTPDTSGIPLYPIAQVRPVNSDGEPDSLNVHCRLRGTVYGVNLRGKGLEFIIHDATAGIEIFSSTKTFGYTVHEGDSLEVSGKVSFFDGETEMGTLDTIRYLGTGSLNQPTVVQALGENTESELIRINGVQLVTPGQWVPAGTGFDVDITDGTNTYSMRIDTTVDLYSEAAPTGTFDVVGLGTQFDTSSAHNTGYEISPRYHQDIITPNNTTPTVYFSSPTSGTFTGVHGSYGLYLTLNAAQSNSVSVQVEIASGNAAYVNNYTTQTVTFPANTTSETVELTITNDTTGGVSHTLTFQLLNPTGGVTIGSGSVFTLTLSPPVNISTLPFYPIAQIRPINSQGLPDSVNVHCRIAGTVYGVNLRTSGLEFTLHDATAGIQVFSSSKTFGYTVHEGDSLEVSGKVSSFDGVTQMGTLDTIINLNTTGAINQPSVVTALGENTESELVRMDGMQLATPSQWPASPTGSGFNVDITDGVNTFSMRIVSTVDIFHQAAPSGTFDVIGIGSQFDTTAAHNTGYEIEPRYHQDILLQTGINEVTDNSFVQVYPNPNNGSFAIALTNTGTAEAEVRMYDVTGKTVYLSKVAATDLLHINAGNLTTGIYMVEVKNTEKVYRTKVIIQK